jgi:hypothetical protein
MTREEAERRIKDEELYKKHRIQSVERLCSYEKYAAKLAEAYQTLIGKEESGDDK